PAADIMLSHQWQNMTDCAINRGLTYEGYNMNIPDEGVQGISNNFYLHNSKVDWWMIGGVSSSQL
ncbi:MAG: hypothetical protein ACRC4N_05405, partial [Gammaproteobacteria bacterium]